MSRGERTLYVYAFAEPGLPSRFTVRGHSLRVLRTGRIEVIAEARSNPPEATPEALLEQHEIVVSLTERVPALVPARYGSLLTERALQSLVDEHAAAISSALERVRARRQMTLRVFGRQDPPPEPASPPATGTEFLERRRAQAHYVPPEVNVIRQQLGPLAADERIEAGGRQDLRVTVYHLVPIARADEYRDRASELQSVLLPHRLTLSGPWPAFAFAPELRQ